MATSVIQTIQGEMPDSKEEYFVALALQKLEIPFDFHVPVGGLPDVLGGMIVDFVVFIPFAEPLEIFGEYWHTGSLGSDDRYRLEVIENHYKREVKIIWGNEADTPEKALQAVRKLFL